MYVLVTGFPREFKATGSVGEGSRFGKKLHLIAIKARSILYLTAMKLLIGVDVGVKNVC